MVRPISTAALSSQNAAAAVEVAQLGKDYEGLVQIVAFSPDGALLACATYNKLYVWDVRRHKPVWECDLAVQAITFNPDGSTLAVASRDILFLDAVSGEQQAMLKGHPQGTTCVAFSPDGSCLASGGQDGVVRIGNLQTRKLVSKMDHAAPVRGLAFSPDSAALATVSWGSSDQPKEVSVWDVASGQQRKTFPCTKEKNLTFSPDGAWLAVDGKIYNLEDRRVIHDLNERQIAFSPDGQIMAACHNNFPTVGLYDAASGDKLAVLKGHGDPVWCVAFNPDGTLLASGSGSLSAAAVLRGEATEDTSDRSVRLWGVIADKPAEEAPRERRPLKRLGEEDDDKEDSLLKPMQDWFNKLSR